MAMMCTYHGLEGVRHLDAALLLNKRMSTKQTSDNLESVSVRFREVCGRQDREQRATQARDYFIFRVP